MTFRQTSPERVITYEGVRGSREFGQIRRRFRRFAIPVVTSFLAWYFLYVLLAAFAPEFMGYRVFGEINVALILGLGQFVSTFAVTTLYQRWARRTLDPMVDRLRDRLEQGGLR
jgi:uncharacterized membrane protein (DUF485 family)